MYTSWPLDLGSQLYASMFAVQNHIYKLPFTSTTGQEWLHSTAMCNYSSEEQVSVHPSGCRS